ncbi:hypothetical protein [Blastococcus saxobsidens]|uniref:Uncharacterized protein n=1 Tax=Blastococcus saxobsidens (strain DD2) TaxID=1146883 RepID=H6RQG8_BLASD|nr:hypothetical protein [Blastococcus saxobsidens]CCG05336.1 conserved membrane protein of unknown function [Blastococcus saxobsidens DD2]
MSSTAVPSTTPARPHHLPAAGLAVVAAGLVAGLPTALGDVGALAAVLVLQLALVLSWVLATGMQGFTSSLAVGTAAAVAADLALVLVERPLLGGLLAVLGVGFLAAVLQQMLRSPRQDLVDSLAGSAVLLTAVAALAALLLLGRPGSGALVLTALVAGAALLVGSLTDQVLPRPQLAPGVPRGLTGAVLAVLAGAAAGWAARDVAGLGMLRALLVGAVLAGVVALVAVAGSYLAVETTAEGAVGALSPWAPTVVQVVLPFAACAPVALGLLTLL